MSRWKTSRRNVLRGLAAGALLPMFRNTVASGSAAEGPRKRLVIWFTSCGTSEPNFRPVGGETDFTLPAILAPLERHRSRLLLLGPVEPNTPGGWDNIRKRRGISVYRDEGESAGHHTKQILTGRRPIIENQFNTIAPGISIDQYVAQAQGGADYLPSLQLGCACEAFPEMIYAGVRQPLPVETNPARAFERVFGGIADGDPAAVRRLARRKQVLQLAGAQSMALISRLEAADRRRVEARYAALEAVVPPTIPSHDPDYYKEANWDVYDKVAEKSAVMIDILAAALGSGLTHVASMQYGWAGANIRSPFVGVQDYLHPISHDRVIFDGPNTRINPEVDAQMVAVQAWYMGQLANLVDKLAAMPESDGTSVMDNTTILVVNELAEGAFHTVENMPFFLVGSAGGYFRTGRYVTFENRSHSDLLVSVLNAMGLPDTTFGDADLCAGALPGLT
jgi:hypothetical protein